MDITYETHLRNVDWSEMKAAVVYRDCGYRERAVGFEKVIGTWLQS